MDSYGKNKIIFNDKNSPKIILEETKLFIKEVINNKSFIVPKSGWRCISRNHRQCFVIFIPAFLTNMLKTIRYKCYHSRYKNKPRRHKG